MGQKKVSCLERCPLFSGFSTWDGEKVSCLEFREVSQESGVVCGATVQSHSSQRLCWVTYVQLLTDSIP